MQERRLFPRYHIDWPATLRGGEGGTFAVAACDFSAAGIGLKVPRAAVVALAQGGSVLTPGDRLGLMIGSGADDGVVFDGRVQHVRRLSRDQYLVALRFEDQGARQEAALAELVERARARYPRP